MATSKSATNFSVLAGGRLGLASSRSVHEKDVSKAGSHLFIIPSSEDIISIEHHQTESSRRHVQLSLPIIEVSSLVLVEMNDIRGSYEFLRLFDLVRPRMVFDLRIRPDFYIDVNLGTPGVLELFKKFSSQYYNITEKLGIDDLDDLRLKPESVGMEMSKIIKQQKQRYPIMVLTAGRARAINMIETLPRFLSPQPSGGWSAILHRDLLLSSKF